MFWYIDPMLFDCWSTVCNVGPTFKQHWVIGSCLLGFVFQSGPYLKWRKMHLYYNRIRIMRLVGLWTNPLTIFLFPVTHCIPHAKHWHSDMVVTLLKTLKDVFWWRNLALNQWSSQSGWCLCPLQVSTTLTQCLFNAGPPSPAPAITYSIPRSA